ncbi:MAG: SRPBCC family protein [Rhodobacter sp.]|nr:SRPBCC family protein [Rhodobacter sp.]
MKPTAMMIATFAGFLATGAGAANYQVQRTLQLPFPSTEVWHLIGDFCDIDDWHPDISGCALKAVEGRLERILTTTEGAAIVEQRIAVESGLSYTYKISASPLPIEGFTATFSIEPIDGARVTWSARFSSDDPSMEAAIIELFETGLAAIESNIGVE